MVCLSAGFRRSLRLCRRRRGQAFGTSQFCSLLCPSSCYSSLSIPYEEVVRYQHHPEHTHRLIALVGEYTSAHMWASRTRPETACLNLLKSIFKMICYQVLLGSVWMNCAGDSSRSTQRFTKELFLVSFIHFVVWKYLHFTCGKSVFFLSVQIPHDRSNATRNLGENITLLAKSSLTTWSAIAGVTSCQT